MEHTARSVRRITTVLLDAECSFEGRTEHGRHAAENYYVRLQVAMTLLSHKGQ